MKSIIRKSNVRTRTLAVSAWCLVWLSGPCPAAPDLASLCADRAAMERVYHVHRLGTKQPFDQAMPPDLLEKLVRQELKKESVLRNAYGVEITQAMVEAEVKRIQATTRAPEVLAEIQHALGDDAARFARTMARPILVERELRHRFDNDDKLHAAQRKDAEQARACFLANQTPKDTRNVTWQLAARPTEETHATPAPSPAPTQANAKSNAYTNDATALLAQPLAAPEHATPGEEKHYFDDLDPELQKVLRVQLQKPGDVSAVIETPGGFLVFQAREKSAITLTATSVSIPKRSYDEWLAQQPEKKP